jgi:hypothetical protein
MATISQLHSEMYELLGPQANQAGRETGFTQRQSKLTGSVFAQALVFSALSDEDLTYTLLAKEAAVRGVEVTPQGIEQRFTQASAELLRWLLNQAVLKAIAGGETITGILPFNGIYLRDSSVVRLPIELHPIWPGVGGSAGATATVKLQVRLEYLSGQVAGPELQSGRAHDTSSSFQAEILPAGALRLGDLGYFDLEQFQKDSQAGVYWLTRYKVRTSLYTKAGSPLDLLTWLMTLPQAQGELAVQVGQVRLPCRLLAQRVPQEVSDQRRRKLREYARKKQVAPSKLLLALAEWTLVLTNLPAEQASLPQIRVLLKLRWQVELLFKKWKSLFKIDEWRSENPWRILTELYAKLLAVVFFHWFTLLRGFQAPQRSLWKAAVIFKRFGLAFALAFDAAPIFSAIAVSFLRCIQKSARLNTRSQQPNTIQDLLQWPSLA